MKIKINHLSYVAILFLMSLNFSFAQNILRTVVKNSESNETLIGATISIKGTVRGGRTDIKGESVINNIPNGKFKVNVTYVGFEKFDTLITFPFKDILEINLISSNEESDEIIVEGTRNNKSIADNPTRVEALTEEIDEASTMDPSKIAHLITHSTGIQVQQTSATSNTANVRIQGLDGRYAQILKDGFPLYGGFSGSLSIMQIPPLDLRQVEYIKGGASTLYGGGAISGLINLLSKEPTKEETLIHLNASQIGAFDVNTYMSKQIGDLGFTLLAQRNTHTAFDADNDGYSDMPQLTKYNFNPKLFYDYDENTKISLGGTFTEEQRQGGDMKLMNNEYPDSNNFYKEYNSIKRITSQFKLEHNLSEEHNLTIKNSFNIFNRSLDLTAAKDLEDYRFAGKQVSTFTEISNSFKFGQDVLIFGANFYTDNFREDSLQSAVRRDENFQTIGAFLNYTFDLNDFISMETGFRGDYVFNQKFFALPRVSALFKWTSKLTTRIGGGLGYRNPSIFNQEAELLGYKNLLPINKSITKAEESYGFNGDIGYKTTIGDNYFFNINQMFFYNKLDKPLILNETAQNSGIFNFVNANGYTKTYGGETFFKFGFYDFVLFVGYTYTNATNHFDDKVSDLTLTPNHSLKGDLLYALPNQWRIGLDYEFKSSQKLSNGFTTPSYWTYGLVVEYTWENLTLFLNIENYTDVRQTNFGSIRSNPNNTPQFTEVWAPLDGIVYNTGIKIRM
ncbi:MAG: TonB-dependent receptor [Candidatus Kapaibacteriota bacterium]